MYGRIEISKRQLRHCSATVFTAKRDNGEKIYLLRSYESNVCEIYHTNRGWEMVLFPRWNYSATTAMHMRKFMEDVMGYYVPVPTIRDIMKCRADKGNGEYFRHNIDPEHENVIVVFGDALRKVTRLWWESHRVFGEWGF